MPKIARIPITNNLVGGDYTARLLIGPEATPMDLLVDTGSSALAVDAKKYRPEQSDTITRLAQTASYGDGSSWTGAVIKTAVATGSGAQAISIKDANVAVAYEESRSMFRGCDGILGLAYAPLDDAFEMPSNTWPRKYSAAQVAGGRQDEIKPYLTQLADEDVVYEQVSFITWRSFARLGHGGQNDPMNQGWMLVGGGVEATDLYTGALSGVKVLADEWYNTNLKAVVVGAAEPIQVPARGAKGMPSNSIVDSGTNSLNLGPRLLGAMIEKFAPDQQQTVKQAVLHSAVFSTDEIKLANWPVLTFVLQGETGHADVRLAVHPSEYWQVDSYKVGAVLSAITVGDDGSHILGLPLMNGYFTVFDGVADNHRGVIRFAQARKP